MSISWDIDNVCKYFQGLYFILFLLYWHESSSWVFFVFFTPAVSFWPSFFCSPKLMLWLKTELLCLKLTTEGWWCPLFLKKKKKLWDLLSCLCNICLKLKMCIFFVFVYTFQRNKGSPFFHKCVSHELLLPTQKQRVEKCGKWGKANLASHVKIMDDTDLLNEGCHFLKSYAETLHCNLLFKT